MEPENLKARKMENGGKVFVIIDMEICSWKLKVY
jgi:hypothetical protein